MGALYAREYLRGGGGGGGGGGERGAVLRGARQRRAQLQRVHARQLAQRLETEAELAQPTI